MTEHKCLKEVDIAVLQETNKNVMKKLDNIENKLDKFIVTADKKYATKEEVQNNQKSLESVWKIITWVAFLVIGWVITAVLHMIFK